MEKDYLFIVGTTNERSHIIILRSKNKLRFIF